MFRRLLIANRGEIACRIARTAQALGIEVLAVYSDADARARHVRLAAEAWPIGAAPAEESYLDARAILAAARTGHADAIHPGYGFLSENAAFAQACAAAGFVFVGPPPAAIAAMGDKAAAKERMARAGVPVLPGYQGNEQSLAALERRGLELGFPLIIKPSAGGGGKGMHIVRTRGELGAALEAARRLARSAFGDERLLLERYVPAARHVEVQLLADTHGRVLHLHDRDCSVQRRHQKLIEEAPAPGLSEALRERLTQAATTVAHEVAYVGAGTVEFLLDGTECFFLEMNTRLQVEHAVTESITGLDLVEWQLRIAAGESLAPLAQQIALKGHAVEVRVCAEDPAREFLPGSGTLALAQWPRGNSAVRVDFGFESGDCVPSNYDSLLGKIVAHAETRSEAIARLRGALGVTRIAGVPTNIGWLAAALDSAVFRAGAVDTGFVQQHAAELAPRGQTMELAACAAAASVYQRSCARAPLLDPWDAVDGFRLSGLGAIRVRLLRGGTLHSARVIVRTPELIEVSIAESGGSVSVFELLAPGASADAPGTLVVRARSGGAPFYALVREATIDVWRETLHETYGIDSNDASASAAASPSGSLSTLLPGVVVGVRVAAGDAVEAGAPLLVVEAMKMEHTIRAPYAGTIAQVNVRAGDRVRESQTLITLQAPPRAPAGPGSSA